MFIKQRYVVERVTGNRTCYIAFKHVLEGDCVELIIDTNPYCNKRFKSYLTRVIVTRQQNNKRVTIADVEIEFDQFCKRFVDCMLYQTFDTSQKRYVDFVVDELC